MYGIFTYIYHKNQPNVGKYTIHGSYGWCWKTWTWGISVRILRQIWMPKLMVPTFRNLFLRKVCGHVFHKAHGRQDVGGFVSDRDFLKIPIWGDGKPQKLNMEVPEKKSLEVWRFRTWKPIIFQGSIVKFRGSKQCKSMAILRDFLLNSVLFGLVI